MCKKIAFVLAFSVLFGAVLPCAAAEAPAVSRVYRTEMSASVAYYGGEKYVALDLVVNDITEPSGLLGFDVRIGFDGDRLVPLWQTDCELNGDGQSLGVPQMITNWPVAAAGSGSARFAAEGLCKPYAKTGKGILNVNLLLTDDMYGSPVFGDGEMAVRLYFKPVGGFQPGAVYNFSIDGQYGETVPQYILVRGVNGEPVPHTAYGFGSSASYTVTWADCGAFDLADTGAALTPDGESGILWTDGIYTVGSLKRCFKAQVRVLDKSGNVVADSGQALPGYSVKTDSGALEIAVRGDINRDGFVSAADYITLKSALCGETVLDGLQLRVADMSRDGAVTTVDALGFRRLFGASF